MGQSWTLGFGPREVGSRTRDLFIGDINLPPVAFELIPQFGGAALVVKSGFTIYVNGSAVRQADLQTSDKITCGKHVLTVEFLV